MLLGYFNLHKVTDFVHHTADGGGVLVDHGVVQSAQAEGLNDSPLVAWLADGASGPGDLYLSHYLAAVSG